MDFDHVTTDQLEQQLVSDEELVARLRSRQLEVLEELDRRQIATADGSRSMAEWVAARLDVGPDTAKRLVGTMRRTCDRPDLREALAEGVSLDRVEALSRITEDIGLWLHSDIAAVRREAAKRSRMTAEEEVRGVDDQFLVAQPSLDESWWKFWGGLEGVSGALVWNKLTETADKLPALPDGTRGDQSWRRAVALVQVCAGETPAPPGQVTVFVDAGQAVQADGEAGVVLEAGPKVGRQALQAVLCDSTVEVTVKAEDGVPMRYGRTSRSVPDSLRRAILNRDGNTCAADGCQSRYRLQIHHIHHWAEGGPTDPENLIALCWFHHQIVVHHKGFTPYRHPEHGRIRFKPPERGPPD